MKLQQLFHGYIGGDARRRDKVSSSLTSLFWDKEQSQMEELVWTQPRQILNLM